MAGSMNWRSSTDISEENRYGRAANPDYTATRVTVLECAGGCGEPITEVRFSDGHTSYDSHGVCSGMGRVWHRNCQPK
jgi:hypothetical protein